MSSFQSRHRHQEAVLWAYNGTNRYGEPLVLDPVEICVRWENKRTEMLDAQGNKVEVEALVVVNQDIAINSQMWLGTLSNWVGTGSAGTDDEVMMVRVFNKTPDIKGRCYRRTVGLSKAKDTPATVG